jgi:ATP-dependent exoDNAse (exonuclease V) alpha subunit
MRKGADGIPFWIKWVYTAITRAKKKVTLVTSRNLSEEPPEVIERALFNSRTPRKLVF